MRMGIDTLSHKKECVTLPIYPKISSPKHNDYTVGEVYDVRLTKDADLEYAHKVKLVAKIEKKFKDIDPYVLALATGEESATDAKKSVVFDDDQDILVLYYLRMDKVEEFVREVDIDYADINWSDITVKEREDL